MHSTTLPIDSIPAQTRPIESGGWFAVYNQFIVQYGGKIGANAIAVFHTIAARVNHQTQSAIISLTTLCKDTALCKNTVLKALNTLYEHDIIEREHRHNQYGDFASNAYRILIGFNNFKSQPIDKDSSSSSEPPRSSPEPASAPDEQIQQVFINTDISTHTTTAELETDSSSKNEELVFPHKLNPKEITQAEHILSPIEDSQTQQQVLNELQQAIDTKRLNKSPINYLAGLVKRVITGEFTPTAKPIVQPKPVPIPKPETPYPHWEQFHTILKQHFDQQTAINFINTMKATQTHDGKLKLHVPNQYAMLWLKQHIEKLCLLLGLERKQVVMVMG